MKAPDVTTEMRDEESGVTYHVMAYRKLTRAETLGAIRHYWSTRKSKKPPKNKTVKILTILGATPGQ